MVKEENQWNVPLEKGLQKNNLKIVKENDLDYQYSVQDTEQISVQCIEDLEEFYKSDYSSSVQLHFIEEILKRPSCKKIDFNIGISVVQISSSHKHCKDKSNAYEQSSDENSSLSLDITKFLKNPFKQNYHENVHVCMMNAGKLIRDVPVSRSEMHLNNFNSELTRLASYEQFPSTVPVFVTKLAASGFFFNPEHKMVECSFCQEQIPIADFDKLNIPDGLHKRNGSKCLFFLGKECGNKPFSSPNCHYADKLQSTFPSFSHPSSNTAEANSYHPGVATVQPSPAILKTPSYNDASSHLPPEIAHSEVHYSSGTRAEQVDTSNCHSSSSPNLLGTAKPDLASSLSSKKISQYSADSAQNEETNGTKQQSESSKKKPLTYGDLGIFAEKPKRPDMAVLQKRLASFDGKWSQNYHQDAKTLADAGMYYAGYADCARCFFCGGGLKNWEPTDSPWIEHARWFPKCTYVRLCKGQIFVDIVQEKNKIKQEIQLEEVEEEIERKHSLQKFKPKVSVTRKQAIEGDSSSNQEDLEQLENENEELRTQTMCKICMDAESSVVFLPCGHLVSCTHCAIAMKQCPLCRTDIKGSVRAHMN